MIRLPSPKKGMGAFLVATLVILVLIFVMFMFLGIIKKNAVESPDLVDFVNRNYFKKNLVLFLDAPVHDAGAQYDGLSMAEFSALYFNELLRFAQDYDSLDVTTLTGLERGFYLYFQQGTMLAEQFNARHVTRSTDTCAFEISTYIDNKKEALLFPIDARRLSSTLVQTDFSGPDGQVYTLRSRCSFNVERSVLGDLH